MSQNGNDAITDIYWEGPACSGDTESNTNDKKVKKERRKHRKQKK